MRPSKFYGSLLIVSAIAFFAGFSLDNPWIGISGFILELLGIFLIFLGSIFSATPEGMNIANKLFDGARSELGELGTIIPPLNKTMAISLTGGSLFLFLGTSIHFGMFVSNSF